MFMEHDDLYYGGGHQTHLGRAEADRSAGECRSNHEVLQALAAALHAVHPGFEMTPRELIDATLKRSGHGDIDGLEADIWRDLQPDFRTSHYLDGFAHADKKFHFKADWANPPFGLEDGRRRQDAVAAGPLARSSRRSTRRIRSGSPPAPRAPSSTPPSTRRRRRRRARAQASVMIHPLDAASLDIADGDAVTLGNARGETTLIARFFDGVRRGVLIAEIGPSEPRPYRRQGHQRADRRRSGGADRRRGVPRQQGLDQEGRCSRRLI